MRIGKATTLVIALHMASVPCTELFGGGVDYSKEVTTGEISTMIFGPANPLRTKMVALNIGRTHAEFKTSLNCGQLDVTGSIKGQIGIINEQLSQSKKIIESMVLRPESLALGLICYFKQSTCSRIRHFQGLIMENFKLEYDACTAMDEFIDEQAEIGMKQRRSAAFKECIQQSGEGMTASKVKECRENAEGSTLNLLYPFKKVIARGKQNFLESITKAVDPDGWSQAKYSLMTKIFGEVRVYKNGYWAQAFPKDMLRPDQVAENVEIEGRSMACDTNKLARIVRGESSLVNVDFGELLADAVKENLDETTIRDLDSIPKPDKEVICASIGRTIAALAIEKFASESRSTFSSALKNRAISEELRVFFGDQAEKSLLALEKAAEKNQVVPLKETRIELAKIATKYRAKNREIATENIGKKNHNKRVREGFSCVDALSCKR